MPATEELRVLITAQDQASQVMRNFGTQSSAVANAVKGAWVGVGIAVTQQVQQALGAAFGAASDAVIGFNASLEQSRVAWTTMLGGAQQAEAMLSQLQQFAATTPFEFPDVERAARRLTAMGFAAKDIIPLLTDIGNAASALGVGTEGVDRITTALGQMSTRTKVSAEDMLQLTEIGVPAWRILAEATGKSIAQVQDAASKGTISSQTFIDAFRKFSQANYGGLMERQSQTFSGAVSNINDSARILLSSAFKPLFDGLRDLTMAFAGFLGSEGVRNFAQGLQNMLNAIGTFFDLIRRSEPIMNILKAAFIGVAGAITVFYLPAMINAARETLVLAIRALPALVASLVRAGIAVTIAAGPWAILAAVIAAAALVIIANWDKLSQAAGSIAADISQKWAVLVQWFTQDFAPKLLAVMGALWAGIADIVTKGVTLVGQVWDLFWQALGESGQEHWTQFVTMAQTAWENFVTVAVNAIRGVIAVWNQFVTALADIERLSGAKLPGIWGLLAGKTIDLDRIAEQIKNIGAGLTDIPGIVGGAIGDAIGNIQKFITGDLAAAVQKAIDQVVAAGGDMKDIAKAVHDEIAKVADTLPDLLGQAGQDAGSALADGVMGGVRPLIESLNRMWAQLRAGPIQAALEDTQAAIERARLLLQIRGLPPEQRAEARRTIRDLTRNVLPQQQLAAFDVNRQVTLAQRAESTTQLLQQIADTQKQLADAQAKPQPIALTINLEQPDGTWEVFYNQLIEANAQAQTPPPIQLSGVRR